ncbi:hypothetical protein B0T18DRAFT_391523 [Schizothecium vesticola]|uniref:Uncharacterized protein n=1 Tax=Schizothecium vesticola TaxID=314040 RepID=A0AA40ENI5_9PEZI|nr:hypothetical protein B0T18DRAFT_391523 [Schizothecium vesticola]
MASTTIATISRSSLADSSGEPPKIADFKHLASYTWRNKTAPTITVPAPRLEPDSGTVFIDQNAAQCPSSPLEPLFRAVLAQDPDFSLRNVDLVTDRGNIRKLLRFVQGFTNDHFRILVEVVRDGDTSTALFTRVEPKTTYTIHGFRGYGMTFETAYTAQGVGMNGYHRTLGYIFAGVRGKDVLGTYGHLANPEADGRILYHGRVFNNVKVQDMTDKIVFWEAVGVPEEADVGTNR